jgi:hypothetical protein
MTYGQSVIYVMKECKNGEESLGKDWEIHLRRSHWNVD